MLIIEPMDNDQIENEIQSLKNLARLRMVPFDEDVLREKLKQKPKFTVTPWGSRQINDSSAILLNARLQIENFVHRSISHSSSSNGELPTKDQAKEWEKVEGVHISMYWLPKAMNKIAFCPSENSFYRTDAAGLWEKLDDVDSKLWKY
jgi:hypothetical protein